MFEKILEFRKSPMYDIINSLKKDIVKATFQFGKGSFKAFKEAVNAINSLKQRRSEMKINVISKEELEDLIDVDKLKQLTENLSGLEKYIPSIAALSAIPAFGKKDDVVVVEKKSSPWKIVVGILIACAAIGGIAFAIYKYFNSDYDDDFFDDIDDEFDDDDDEDDTDEELFEE